MQRSTHSSNGGKGRRQLTSSIAVLVLAATASAGCGASDGGAAPPATASASTPTTSAVPTTAPATAVPSTAAPTTAPSAIAATTTAARATPTVPANPAPTTGPDAASLSTTPLIAEQPASADAVDWIADDGKAEMKIDPAWTATGNAPAEGSGIPFTLEGEWTIGETTDGTPTIVSVATYQAGDATLDNLGELFWLTHKGVEKQSTERVMGPNGNALVYFEVGNGDFQSTGFVSIENGTLAVAEVSSHTDNYEAAAAQAGPLLFTIQAL